MFAIVLVVLGADAANAAVSLVLDAGGRLAGPFDGLLSLEGRRLEVAVNWGIAAAVYLLAGRLLARLIDR